jgi:hypothetical protein
MHTVSDINRRDNSLGGNRSVAVNGRVKRAFAAAFVVGLSALLAGCESGGGLLAGGSSAQPEAQLAPAQQVAAAQTRVSIAPVIGAPDSVSKQLFQDFTAAIGQKAVVVVGAQDKADYALRGYIVAAKDKAGTKVSYIWDVADPAGKRVNRITGEEIVAGAAASDPWASVTPQVTQSIARKASDSLHAWLAQNSRPTVASAVPSQATAAGPGVPATVGTLPPAGATTASALAAPKPASAVALTTAIPTLVGAPGDGNSTLASALQAELSKNGVPPAGPGATAYRVEGVVKVGNAADGKQAVQIDWNVKDPAGKRLGTVTQKNEIAAGSLDGTWGKTADAAASAAAAGILKLLPRQTASN